MSNTLCVHLLTVSASPSPAIGPYSYRIDQSQHHKYDSNAIGLNPSSHSAKKPPRQLSWHSCCVLILGVGCRVINNVSGEVGTHDTLFCAAFTLKSFNVVVLRTETAMRPHKIDAMQIPDMPSYGGRPDTIVVELGWHGAAG